MNASTLSRIADNVTDVVHDAVVTSKDFVTDVAGTVGQRAPDVADQVGAAVRSGAEKAPDVGRRVAADAVGIASALASRTPWGRRRARRGLLRRVAPWVLLVGAAGAIVYVVTRRPSKPTVATDTHAAAIR